MKLNHSWVRYWGGVFGLVAAVAGVAASSADAWARNPVLAAISEDARDFAAIGVQPVVVMDLDETVVDSTLRRWAAYQLVRQKMCAVADPFVNPFKDAVCDAVLGLNVAELYALPNRYSEVLLAGALGLDPELPAWKEIAKSSLDEYLSGRYEYLDQPVPGANAYVRELKRNGAHVWFVSSRWSEAQGASTLRSLLALGLIEAGEESSVILRPKGMSSIDFKRMAFARIREATRAEGGQVVGAFENEPENISAMEMEFPGVRLVFVEGAWIKEGGVPAQAARITTYR